MGEPRMGVILTYEPDEIALYLKVRPFLKRANVLLDIGAGVRPQRFVECKRHVCIEAHGEYCDVLRENGYETIQALVPDGLIGLDIGNIDTAIAVDVIEHLPKGDGFMLLSEMQRMAKQAVIFTPLGYMPQDGGKDVDPWGYQGQFWQKHRSGWTPDDFHGWRCFVDEDFHTRERGSKAGAFFAVWDRA
jgi:hypothetical protein